MVLSPFRPCGVVARWPYLGISAGCRAVDGRPGRGRSRRREHAHAHMADAGICPHMRAWRHTHD
eukprot:8100317-Alexandrium_andersonii.AAC.1